MTQITFQRACELWKNEKKRYVKESTMAVYSLAIQKHLGARFGNLDEITSRSVQTYIDSKLKGGISVTTIKGHLVILKMILEFGERQGWISHRIIDVRFPTQRKSQRIMVLSVNEEQRLLDYLAGNHDLYSLGVQICLFTGMRIGEVCALKWKDVDMESGIIRVRRTVHRVYVIDKGPKHSELTIDYPKTASSYRDIPIVTELSDILKESSSDGQDSESFVISGLRRPTEPQTMRYHYWRLVDTLGLSSRRFHGLRHTFATRCVESKCDYKTLSTILGHTNTSTTLNLYVHPGIEQKRKCVEDMIRSIK